MNIRKLTQNEYIDYEAICQTVFFDIERKDIRAMLKNPEKYASDDVVWGAFNEQGKLSSAVTVVPVQMQLNGSTVKTGIIAGVVTRPEARGKGYIRQIMKHAFSDMIKKGQILSFVYPFSFAYYRQFGYENSYAYNRANIPISQFRGYKYPERIEAYEGVDIQPFTDIYETFSSNRNFAIHRDEAAWEEILDRDPYLDSQFTFLHYDKEGCADAYILYEPESEGGDDEGHNLNIKELCWKTPQGLMGIFGFISKLSSEYSEVHWNVPNDIDVHSMFPESFDLSLEREGYGMARLVDVEAALSLLAPAVSRGEVLINVKDDFIQENTATYKVAWEPGKPCKVTSLDTSNCDLETTVETLAQLLTGYISCEECIYRKGTKINANRQLLSALFPKRLHYMMEHY